MGMREERFMKTNVMPPAQVTHEVKAEKRVSLTRIMVMTDFSDVSDLALQYALAIARRYDARIYLTHIISPDSYQLAEPGLAEITYQKMRPGAEQGLVALLVSGRLGGVAHEVLLQDGNIWLTVERLVKKY